MIAAGTGLQFQPVPAAILFSVCDNELVFQKYNTFY
jgi:hypothetical protein